MLQGGLKIWECSEDLARYLHDTDLQLRDKSVLELGCGAGLPGLLALTKGASGELLIVIRIIELFNLMDGYYDSLLTQLT